MLGRVDLPDFLKPDAVVLRVAACVEVKFADQLLAEVAAATFGEDRVLGMQFHAGHIGVLVAAVLCYAHVAGSDALYAAVFVVQHFGRREAGVNLYTHALSLLRHPAADVAQAYDVVAVIVKSGGEHEGHTDRA